MLVLSYLEAKKAAADVIPFRGQLVTVATGSRFAKAAVKCFNTCP